MTCTSTVTTWSRTPRSCSVRRSARRWVTSEGIRRFGDALVPLDEALAQAVVDVSGRPYCVHTGEPPGQEYVLIGGASSSGPGACSVRGVADPARVRDPGLPRPPLPARHRAWPAATPTTSWRPSSRRSRGLCGMRSLSIRGWKGCPAPRVPCEVPWVPVITKRVVVLDYGSGNLRSAERAVARAGVTVVVTADADLAVEADGLVVPGVGAFAACMAGLTEVGGPEGDRRTDRPRPPDAGDLRRAPGALRVRHRARRRDARLRGLARSGGTAGGPPTAPHGLEHRATAGREPACSPGSRPSSSTSCTPTGSALLSEDGRLITWAEHGGDRFVAAVEQGPVWSTQFHPEKSGDAGAQLIKNWVGGAVSRPFDAVIFDLGGVVLGWDPTRAFAEVLPPDQVEAFMTKIDFPTWNSTHDAGQLFDEGEAELLGRFPDDERAIRAYRTNFAPHPDRTGAGDRRRDRRAAAGRRRTGGADQLVGRDLPARRAAVRDPAPVRRDRGLRHRRRGQARSRHLRVGLRAVRARPAPHGVRRRLRGQRRRRLGGRTDGRRVRRRRSPCGRTWSTWVCSKHRSR